MGIRSKINQWIQKRIIGAVLDDAVKSTLSGFLKNEILNTVNDEEVAKALMGYGDSFYDRYHSKFTGWLGGTTKGVNSVIQQAVGGEIQNSGNNGLFDLISGMEGKDFSLANGLKLLLMSSQGSNNNNNSIHGERQGVMS